jgi:hypothetical protein
MLYRSTGVAVGVRGAALICARQVLVCNLSGAIRLIAAKLAVTGHLSIACVMGQLRPVRITDLLRAVTVRCLGPPTSTLIVGLNDTPNGPSPVVGESELSRESEFVPHRVTRHF